MGGQCDSHEQLPPPFVIVYQGFSPEERELLWKMLNPPSRKVPKDSIVICHRCVAVHLLPISCSSQTTTQLVLLMCSEPGAWAVPKSLFSTTPCPPGGHKGYTIGRTMFETDR